MIRRDVTHRSVVSVVLCSSLHSLSGWNISTSNWTQLTQSVLSGNLGQSRPSQHSSLSHRSVPGHHQADCPAASRHISSQSQYQSKTRTENPVSWGKVWGKTETIKFKDSLCFGFVELNPWSSVHIITSDKHYIYISLQKLVVISFFTSRTDAENENQLDNQLFFKEPLHFN